MATVEELVRRRLTETAELTQRLAVYGRDSAVFLQLAPDDIDKGWKNKVSQYPRIEINLDTATEASREKRGQLIVDAICSTTGTPPEELEPIIRQSLSGVIFSPTKKNPFVLKWLNSKVFDIPASERKALLVGVTITFELNEFPKQETSEPDPVAALNNYMQENEPAVAVIGCSILPEIFQPGKYSPAVWVRVQSNAIDRVTNTVTWRNVALLMHVFAPTTEDKLEWVADISQGLAVAAEVVMQDGAPMLVNNISSTANADELDGQLVINCTYGTLRRVGQEVAGMITRARFRG